MKTDILLYVDGATTDESLIFKTEFLPDKLTESLKINGINDIYFSIPENYSGRLSGREKTIQRKQDNEIESWKSVFSATGSDHLVKIFADSPFTDPTVITEMLDLHLKYMSEFTYSENLPEGVTCEIFSRELIEALPEIKDRVLPLGQVIRSNINQFDVELFYKDPDIRDKRISFRSGIARDRMIMERIIDRHGRVPSYSEIKDIIDSNPQVLYTGPSYLELELTGRCDLDCVFCYRNTLKKVHGDMDIGMLNKIIAGMTDFGLPYSLCLGGSGEPMMHTGFYEALESILSDTLLKSLFIETNGLYADSGYAAFIKGKADPRIKTIFNMNAHDSETYRALHRGDHFETVYKNAMGLYDAVVDKDTVFIQIMKINETEPYLDKYYDFWEPLKIQIILQKQSTCLGRIPDRRYSDLSPLDRIPCWHLQRDAYILSDGRVAFCKQDVDCVNQKGDLKTESLKEIWDRRIDDFISDYRKKYPANPDCMSCDEWYTFNY
ncbi:MAG: spiro-SPASM protein [Spirochaetes bacterium]|nr:spiro-SPASM protein [Spirochaetota bacterium]